MSDNMVKRSALPAIEINPVAKPRASVIWLHGLGASGHDFAPWVAELPLPSHHDIRFVLPHAPIQSITINQGMKMRAWYDIATADLLLNEDKEGIQTSQQLVEQYIANECERGIDAKCIILAGFSQGGAMALHCGLRYPKALGGIIALSTYLPCQDAVSAERQNANHETPIFMAHGTLDNIVPYELGHLSYTQLRQLGYAVDWYTYEMDHTVIEEEMSDIAEFIMRVTKWDNKTT